MLNRNSLLAILCAFTVALPLQSALAIKIKIKQSGSTVNRVYVSTSEEGDVVADKNGTVNLSGKTAHFSVLTDDGPLSVVVAYKVGNKTLPAKKVLANTAKYCADGNAEAFTAVKGKGVSLNLETRSESGIAIHKGKISKGKKAIKKQMLTGNVSVGVDCLPSGNGLTLGIGGASSLKRAVDPANALPTDIDQDGLLDALDADIDGDGVLNNFDTSNATLLLPTFSVFSNLKVGLENTVNVNALGREPTKDEVDALTSNTTLAIEVKATGTDESELDCGTLSYCSAGGTGTVLNTSDAFPGAAGGAYDSDSDGNGTITKGPTGDFQLATHLSSFAELDAGDAYIQTVTPSGSTLASIFLASLQFAFRATPAMQSITFDPDGTAETTSFSYPVSNGSAGTPSNCIEVSPDSNGDVIAEIVAWRPQRKGLSALGEASFVDLGNSKVVIDIPNAPAANGSTPTGGPGNCPASSYTESDANLALSGDALQDSLGDTDADPANRVTFRVNVTDCLASVSQTLDAGEELKIDLQFRNDVGDNAAQAFCIERPGT